MNKELQNSLITISTLARQFFRENNDNEKLFDYVNKHIVTEFEESNKLLSVITNIRIGKYYEAMADLLSFKEMNSGIIEDWTGKVFEKMDKPLIAEEFELKSAKNIPSGRFALVRFCARHFKVGEPWKTEVMKNCIIPHIEFGLKSNANLQVEKSAYSRLASFAAWYCYRIGELESVEKFLKISIENLDDDLRSIVGLADVFIRINKIESALPLLEIISDKDPLELERLSESSMIRVDTELSGMKDIASRRIVGLALYYRKEFDKAIPHLRYIYNMDKKNHKIGIMLAKSLIEIRDDEAENIILNIANEGQIDKALLISLIDFHYKYRNTSYAEIVEIIEEFLELNPHEHQIIVLAQNLYLNGLKDKKRYRDILSRSLNYVGFPENILQNIIRDDFLNMSELAFEYGYKFYPNSQYFYIQKAIYIKAKDQEKAKRLFQKGLEVQPGDNEGRYQYILFLHEIGELQQILNVGLSLLDANPPADSHIVLLLNVAAQLKDAEILKKIIKSVKTKNNFNFNDINVETLNHMYTLGVEIRSTEIITFIALTYLSNNQYKKSISVLHNAKEFKNDDIEVYRLLYVAAFRINDQQLIAEIINLVVTKNIIDLNFILMISEFYNKHQRWDDSLTLLRLNQKKFPELFNVELTFLCNLNRITEAKNRVKEIQDNIEIFGDNSQEIQSIIDYHLNKLKVQKYPDDDITLWSFYEENKFYIDRVQDTIIVYSEDSVHFVVLIEDSSSEISMPLLLIVYEGVFTEVKDEEGNIRKVETKESKDRFEKFKPIENGFKFVFETRQAIWQSLEDQNRDILKKIYKGILIWDKKLGLALKILYNHLLLSLDKFEKYVVCYAFTGSSARGEYKYNSDIDFWIVIDDTDLKKMSPEELSSKLIPMLKNLLDQSLSHYGLDKKGSRLSVNDFHIQVHLLTSLWDYFSKGNPIISTFIQEGLPLYDRNIFSVWKRMWQYKYLFPQKFIIEDMRTQGLEARNIFEKKLKFVLAEDIYQRIKQLLRAALNRVGIISPSPANLSKTLKKAFVDSQNSILPTEYNYLRGFLDGMVIDSVDRLLKNFKRVEHEEIKFVDGVFLNTIREDLVVVVDAFFKLFEKIDQIEAKLNE